MILDCCRKNRSMGALAACCPIVGGCAKNNYWLRFQSNRLLRPSRLRPKLRSQPHRPALRRTGFVKPDYFLRSERFRALRNTESCRERRPFLLPTVGIGGGVANADVSGREGSLALRDFFPEFLAAIGYLSFYTMM